jgi:hypothetical protein
MQRSPRLSSAHLPLSQSSARRAGSAFSLLGKCRPIISGVVPTIDLPDDELAAVTATIRRAIEDDRFPHAPRLDPLRAALARLDAASKPVPELKAPSAAKADKRARR